MLKYLLSQILSGLDDPIFGSFPLSLLGDWVIEIRASLLSLILVKGLQVCIGVWHTATAHLPAPGISIGIGVLILVLILICAPVIALVLILTIIIIALILILVLILILILIIIIIIAATPMPAAPLVVVIIIAIVIIAIIATRILVGPLQSSFFFLKQNTLKWSQMVPERYCVINFSDS